MTIFFKSRTITSSKQRANNMRKFSYIGMTDPDNYNNQYQINLCQIEQIERLTAERGKPVIDKAFRTKSPMEIDKLIEILEQGDIIVICDLKYLAASMNRLLERLDAIEARGGEIKVLSIEGNSLAVHAKALRDFNKFYRGSKISKTMLEQNDKNNEKNVIKNTKASIQCWDEQQCIAIAKNTGRMTVKELSLKHKVSRQAIYRICNKSAFKDAIAHQYHLETWKRWRFVQTIFADIKRGEKSALVTITTADKLLELHSYTTENVLLQRPKAEKEFLDKPDNELDRIFDRAVQQQVNQWNDEKKQKIEDNIKKRGEKQKRKEKRASALTLKRKKAHELALKQRHDLDLKQEKEQ